MNRRSFMKVAGLAGGGIVLAGRFGPLLAAEGGSPSESGPWFYVEIARDNALTFTMPKHEMGQGSSSGFAMLLVEELGASWEDVRIVRGTWDKRTRLVYGEIFGIKTSGSSATRTNWNRMREAGATLKDLLLSAASLRWKCGKSECYAEGGFVRRKGGRQRFSFGELAEQAGSLPLPTSVALKERKDCKVIGRPLKNHYIKELVSGRMSYGIDIRLPEMLYASIERCPVFEGALIGYDDSETRKLAGIIDVFPLESFVYEKTKTTTKAGVVVVGNSTWAAQEGRRKLKITWDEGINGSKSSKGLLDQFDGTRKEVGKVLSESGNVDAALSKAEAVFEEVYVSNYQAHACMEPLNATARFQNGQLELWSAMQYPQRDIETLSIALDIPKDAVTAHDLVSGGSFGRRFSCDFKVEAALVAKRMDKPVKLTWTREDAIQNDYYHSFMAFRFRASLDAKKRPSGLLVSQTFSQGEWSVPYYHPNSRLEFHASDKILETGAWRSVTVHPTGFAQESYIDELARNAGVDPSTFRLELLDRTLEQSSPDAGERVLLERFKRVLKVAVEKADWGKPLPKGHGQGVAVTRFGPTCVCQIAEVSVVEDDFHVHKVTCVADSGQVLNPQMARGQLEGSIIWALTALKHGGIDVVDGRVQQSNFHDYQLLKIGETPAIDIHLLESEGAIGGFGEPGVPPLAPAVLNAIYAASGKRIRSIPVRKGDIRLETV